MSNSEDQSPRLRDGWHLRKEISAGHILMTVALALTAAGYAVTNESRHTSHELRLDGMEARLERQDAAEAAFRSEIRSDVRNIGKEVQQSVNMLRLEMHQSFNRLSDKLDDKADKK